MTAATRKPITTAQFLGAAGLATVVAILLLIGVTGAGGLLGFGVVFLMDRKERNRPLPAKEIAFIVASLFAFVMVLIVMKRSGIDDWPALRKVLQHPAFVVPLWTLLIAIYVKLWRPWQKNLPTEER